MPLSHRRVAVWTSALYIALAATWIFVSDLVLAALVPDADASVDASIMKGLGFVLVTGLILYATLSAQLGRWRAEVSRREEVEVERRLSDERFRTYVQHAPMALVVLDPQGHFLEANDEALRVFDRDGRRIGATGLVDLVAPEDVPVVAADIAGLRPGQAIESRIRVLRRDGSHAWVQQRAVRLADGHVLSFGFDITQDVARSHELERLSHLYRASSRVSEAAARATGREALLAEMCTIAAEAGFTIATIGVVGADGVATLAAVAGPGATLAPRGESLPAGCPVVRCLASGRPIPDACADDGSEATRAWIALARAHGIQHGAAFPIRVDGRAEAAFSVGTDRAEPFSDADLKLLEHIANNVATALANLARDAARTLAEQALRESDERFQLLARTIGEVFWMTEPETARVIYVSPAVEAMFGIPPDTLYTSPRAWFEAIEPLDRPLVEGALAGLLRGAAYDIDFRIRRPDGTRRWINDRGYVRRDATGRVALTMGVATDVTDKKRANEELRKLSRAVEQSPAQILITDVKGAIEYVNTRFAQATGWTFEEVRGKNPRILQSGLTPAATYEALWRALGDKREWRGELVNRTKDGQPMHVLATISPIVDELGKTTHYLAVHEDITATKRTETALRESEERLRTLLESMPAGIFVAVDGRFDYLNRKAAELLGAADPDALRGRPVLDHFADPSRARAAERLAAVQDHGRPWPLAEERCVTLAGNVFDAELSSVPLALGVTRSALVFFRDIADRRRLEAQLRQAQKMEAVGTLAGGVAHDFNNMLTVIQSGASMLDTPDLDPAEGREIVTEIRDSAERAAALTRQLLLFSRKERMMQHELDLNEVVANLTRMLRRILGEHIALRTSHAAQLPLVMGDVGMLEQVLMNLVVNARDAMPTGGQLEIGTDSGVIAPGAADASPDARPGPWAGLFVRDNGTGMTAEVQAHIFEPFFTTKEVGRGTGLGLATVYGIVQQHQGWIELDSAPGQGTTFHIRLPAVAEPRATPRATGAAPRVIDGGHETILLVEDDDTVRRSSSAALARKGYTVLQARTGVEALEAWHNHQDTIALLLTDLVMPDRMSGTALAARLVAERPALKVIYSSGYAPGEDLGSPANAAFLAKPYTVAKLTEAVRQQLDAAPSVLVKR